jgi:hypothetical protein
MAVPFSYYVIGNNYTYCPACRRQFRFRETQYTKRVSCPYVDCRRVFFPEHKLVPATCRPFKPPTSEQIEPIAEPLESDS